MPLQKCIINGKSGWKWGESGKCYTGINAKQKAINQALAIGEGKMIENIDDINMEVNRKAITFLNGLINQGKINTGSWSFSASDGNKLLGTNNDDWDTYAKIHLTTIPDADEKTKQRYGFPVAKIVGDSIQIFRRGVIAAKSIAAGGRGAPNRPNIFNAASNLLKKINEKLDIKDNSLFFDAFDETKLLLTEKMQKTPEGFLKTQAIVTNTGIFNYITADGTLSRQLRDIDEVMKPESLETLKNIPIADMHPKKLITADNIENLQKEGKIVGYTGSRLRNDGHAVSIDLTITNRDMINKIESGQQKAISPGYNANVDHNIYGYAYGNNYYDAQQRDINYNHLALVPQGRAGDLAQIILDTTDINDVVYYQYIDQTNNTNKEDVMDQKNNSVNIITANIQIDGIDYIVDRDIAKYIKTLEIRSDELQKELSDMEGKKDAFESEVVKLKEDIEKSKINDKEIQDAVNSRLKIIEIANHLKLDFEDPISNKDLKIAIIKNRNDKVSLDNKDDNYINAYYDSVVDMLQSEMENHSENKNKEKVFSDYVKNENLEKPKTKQELYDEYCKKLELDSKKYKGTASIENGRVIINN